MGCASSSPLINGEPSGIIGKAKHAAHDMIQTGETTLHDVGETINDTVGHVKEAVVGAVHNVGHGIDSAISGKKDEPPLVVEDLNDHDLDTILDVNPNDNNTAYKYIPLKDVATYPVEENLEEFRSNLLKKTQSFSDDTIKMTDELMKETEDVMKDAMEDANASMTDAQNETMKTVSNVMETAKDGVTEIMDINKTPVHSIDSLKTGTPEPEIERILQNTESPKTPSPKPTMLELEDLEATPDEVMAGDQVATTITTTTVEMIKTDSTEQNEMDDTKMMPPEHISSTINHTLQYTIKIGSIIGNNTFNNNNNLPSEQEHPSEQNNTLTSTTTTIDSNQMDDIKNNESNANKSVLTEMNSLFISTYDSMEIINDDDENDENVCNNLTVIETTHWEKLADAIEKLPVAKMESSKPTKSASVDNLFEKIEL